MQTQQPGSEKIETSPTPPKTPSHQLRRWLAGMGALLVVIAVVVSSVLVFSLASRGRGNPGNGHIPTGQWQAVQQGYLFLSVKASATNPAVLYACATTSAAVSNQGTTGNASVLRSADGGDTWQNIGASLTLGSDCQLAINPTNSNDVYIFSGGDTAQTPSLLYHSTDGGKTWQTIQPLLSSPSIPPIQHLLLQQMTFAGNSLLAVAWNLSPVPAHPIRATPFIVSRLVRSSDGGRSWTIIDNQFTAQGLITVNFAVDPAQPNIIYDMLGHPILPIQIVPPGGIEPAYGINEQLYKTTDGGASWKQLLAQVPYGSQVQLAPNNPSIVYVGGVQGPIPLVPRMAPGTPNKGIETGTTLPVIAGGFHLQVSRDGGASWKTVAAPPNQRAILNWFVSPDGHVIASPAIAATTMPVPGESPTAIVGTAVPATPVSGTPVVPLTGTATGATTHSTSTSTNSGLYSPAGISPPPGKSFIVNYNPASNSWSNVTTPPESGSLLAVTPGANGKTTLWFMGIGTTGTQYTLYRYAV
jgi:hypothetical protein